MNQDPLVHRLTLSIDRPSLSDSASDWERLGRALRSHVDQQPLEATLTILGDLGSTLRRGEWNAAVTLADTGTSWRVLRVEPSGRTAPAIALAIDLGTTTIVGEVLNMDTGCVLASEMAYNAQRSHGNDVTSRMMHAERAGGLEELRQKVLLTLNHLIAGLCEKAQISPKDAAGVVIAGNTMHDAFATWH